MNILLVSQCEKKALKETRRIIDQFAERCGDRTWQTAITKQGLETLYQLIKKTARKNTAVACHWIRGKNKTELLWVVGNRNQFNDRGRVPTNRTKRKLVQSPYENNWRDGASIRMISTLAALLHDIGKATIGFQEKLRGARNGADPYRHEWISLQLFILMIQGCKTNEDVLKRLMTFDEYQKNHPDWYANLSQIKRDRIQFYLDGDVSYLDSLPSIAKWVGWLIVSHHRMPFTIRDERVNRSGEKDLKDIEKQKDDDAEYVEDLTPQRFFKQLQAFKGWVCPISGDDFNSLKFWELNAVITQDSNWLKRLQNEAREALAHPPLVNQGDITDPFLLHFSRLSLMIGDYHFSSQENKTESFEEDETKLLANTKHGYPNQTLEEHLIGVAKHTKQMARSLPFFSKNFPTLVNKELSKRTTEQRFLWQNRAFDLAKTLQLPSDEAGFFGVNMASTGCGKTVANVRILYGLTHPKQGARLTIALGLRILTLQTGRAVKDMLGFKDNESVAIVVGGNKIHNLFASEYPTENEKVKGSDSTEELLFEFVDGGRDVEDEISTVIKDEKSRKLLLSPVVACTIDHLTHVTECTRGGKYIVPTLRLFSSDVILDEPDDFDQNDLPALARLVFSVGFCGRKILLSSATLTPDLILGLFNAYQAGRKIWQHQQNKPNLPIPCGWFDEFNQSVEFIATQEEFTTHHLKFVEERIVQLKRQTKRRKAEIMPLLDYRIQKSETDKQFFSNLALQIKNEACKLHGYHHNIDPQTKKKMSVGLVRLSHTRNVIALARGMYEKDDLPHNTQCHLVVYHAKQLQLLRNKLEERLDKILNRSEPLKLFDHSDIRNAIDGSSAENHIFIVVSTPITEVGRDHDYDWAIIEPSSMRSIIQLAGRVWRHRPEKEAVAANISILGNTISALREDSTQPPYYCKPGFETKKFLLTAHECKQLISEEELDNITAIPRIQNTEKTTNTLKGLEHMTMAHLFNTSDVKVNGENFPKRKSNVVTSYWQPDLAHAYCTHLQHLTPFRQSKGKETEYVCQYNEDNERGLHFSTAEKAREFPDELSASSENGFLRYQSWDTVIQMNPRITPWLTCELDEELTNLKEKLGKKYEEWSRERLAVQFSTVTLRNEQAGWCYHPWFGFYQEK